MLIEDNPGDARLVQEMLDEGNSQFHLEWADHLQTGLELLDSEDIDLVLLDLGLPDNQGLDGFEKIHSRKPSVPVIAITGLDDEKVSTEGIRRGLQDCLIKGKVEGILLLRTINYAIERQRLQLELERFAKELKDSEARLRNIIEQNVDGIIIVDQNGTIRFVNNAAVLLFERKSDELLGQNFGFPITVGEKTELEINRKSGEPLTAEMYVNQITWEGKIAYQASLRDITEHKQLAEAKDEFISTVSHELRTPLSIIKEAISLVLDGIPGEINERQKKILVTSKKNIDRLARLINDLLDMSKIKAGKVELRKTWVDVSSTIKKVVSAFESTAKEKGLELITRCPGDGIDIYVDEDKIIQLLTILIDDSIKFTSKGSIEVYGQEKDEVVEYSVADTGIGVHKEYLPNLFDKFTQFGRVDGPWEKGTGLGLSIAKGIVEMHKGKIWVESEVGQGTKFTFTLPKLDYEEILKQYLSAAIKEAERKESFFSVIRILVLNFKALVQESNEKVNATMKEIVELIKNSLRSSDIVVSNAVSDDAGEIFILLPGTKREGAILVLGRTKEKVRQYFLDQKKLERKINFNTGIVSFPEDTREEREILSKLTDTKNGEDIISRR